MRAFGIPDLFLYWHFSSALSYFLPTTFCTGNKKMIFSSKTILSLYSFSFVVHFAQWPDPDGGLPGTTVAAPNLPPLPSPSSPHIPPSSPPPTHISLPPTQLLPLPPTTPQPTKNVRRYKSLSSMLSILHLPQTNCCTRWSIQSLLALTGALYNLMNLMNSQLRTTPATKMHDMWLCSTHMWCLEGGIKLQFHEEKLNNFILSVAGLRMYSSRLRECAGSQLK